MGPIYQIQMTRTHVARTHTYACTHTQMLKGEFGIASADWGHTLKLHFWPQRVKDALATAERGNKGGGQGTREAPGGWRVKRIKPEREREREREALSLAMR